MSEVNNWLTTLGKFFLPYRELFKESGVNELDILGSLEINDIIELGVKKVHATIIYRRYKKEFGSAGDQNLKPAVVMITEKSKIAHLGAADEEKINSEDNKIDINQLGVCTKDLPCLFQQDSGFDEVMKFAEVNSVIAKAIGLLHEQRDHISTLQKDPPSTTHRGFLSHVQQHSSDLCRSLFYGLKEKKTKVWFDMDAGRLDAVGMANGIASSAYFVLVATKNSFSRPWPIFELLIAQALQKPIIVAVEADSRHGGVTFQEFTKLIPKPWQFLQGHEFMKIERRGDFWIATIKELHRRLNQKTKDERQANEEADEKTKKERERELERRSKRIEELEKQLKAQNFVKPSSKVIKQNLVKRCKHLPAGDYGFTYCIECGESWGG